MKYENMEPQNIYLFLMKYNIFDTFFILIPFRANIIYGLSKTNLIFFSFYSIPNPNYPTLQYPHP